MTVSQLDSGASVALATLKRKEKSARKAFNEADAVLFEARAAHRRKPNADTLEAVDVAQRARRQARGAWNAAYDARELAETGGPR